MKNTSTTLTAKRENQTRVLLTYVETAVVTQLNYANCQTAYCYDYCWPLLDDNMCINNLQLVGFLVLKNVRMKSTNVQILNHTLRQYRSYLGKIHTTTDLRLADTQLQWQPAVATAAYRDTPAQQIWWGRMVGTSGSPPSGYKL